MKILFLEPYPIEGPSSRYRVEQYISYFENNGIRCTVRPFISSKFYKILYKKGFYLQKGIFFLQSSFKRVVDIFTAINSDIIFIHLEAFPFGPPVLESIFFVLGKKIIYDLDDAIYLGIASSANAFLKYLKRPSKIREIIKISSYVITCNTYLGNYAKKINQNVMVIHTSVDTEKFLPDKTKENKIMTIGWIGSHSTARYLDSLVNVFRKLATKHIFELKIIGAGEYKLNISGINVINKHWDLSSEIQEFRSLDIGVYPLPDDEWTRGKTGFKTIQYMSVGIPCVVSNTGANKDIVADGVNGYLAKTEDEWLNKISALIENRELRNRIGQAGRETIEKNYSIKVNAPKYLQIIKRVYDEST